MRKVWGTLNGGLCRQFSWGGVSHKDCYALELGVSVGTRFTDDTELFRMVESKTDSEVFQKDLYKLLEWVTMCQL